MSLRPFVAIPEDLREWSRWMLEQDAAAQIVDGSITLEQIEDIASQTFLGRNTTGSGSVEELSAGTSRSVLNVEDGSTADQTDAEIETAYNSQVAAASQAEAEAGTETAIRRWSPLRVAQAIAGLADDKVSVTVTVTSYSVTTEDIIFVDDDTVGSQVTINLPLANSRSSLCDIKKLGSTANVVVDGNSAQTIDDGLTATLTSQYESITIGSDGVSNWNIL